MTIQEYWDKNNEEDDIILCYDFAEEFSCWIQEGKVWMEEYGEGAFELKHIKTINQYVELHKLLVGVPNDLFKLKL